MEVFISWSGPRSQAVAEALRDWLPNVIQAVQPWMSETDIDKGTNWALEIGQALERMKVGILCLTTENQQRPWISFEAGALAKTMETAYVIPYLIQLPPRELIPPLSQFQYVEADQQGTERMVRSINNAMGEQGLSPEMLSSSFNHWWSDLEALRRGFSLPLMTGMGQNRKSVTSTRMSAPGGKAEVDFGRLKVRS